VSYATPADVRTSWDGEATDDFLQALIDRAERRLERRVPDLAERISDGRLNSEDVADVVADIVARFLNNPKGYVGEHAGEVGYYYAQGQKVAPAGKIAITDSDLADLGIRTGARVGSARLRVPSQHCGSAWS
jgi:hypothetical protein